MGASDYESRLGLYLKKRGELDWPDQTLDMALGHAMEPIIDGYIQDTYEIKTMDPGDYAVHLCPEIPWLFSTPDRIDEYDRIHEYKSGGWHQVKRWQNGPPLGFRVQNQTQLLCGDVQHGIISGIVGDKWKCYAGVQLGREVDEIFLKETQCEFMTFEQERHDVLCKEILTECDLFLKQVHDGTPPAAVMGDFDLIKIMHPNDNGESVYPDNAEALFESLEEAKEEIKQWEDVAETAKVEIAGLMGDATFIHGNGRKYSLKTQNRANGFTIRVDHTTTPDEIHHIREILDSHNIPHKFKDPTTHRVLRAVKGK